MVAVARRPVVTEAEGLAEIAREHLGALQLAEGLEEGRLGPLGQRDSSALPWWPCG